MLYKFKEAVDIISGGTPKTSVPEYWNGDIGWLSVVDFGDKNKYVETTEKTITQAGVDNSSTKVLQINDIIISARGTVGAMAMLKKPLAFNQSCFGLRGKTEIINQEYLFYYLKNYMKVLKAKTQGSVFDTINLATFDLIDLNLPTLDKQERIAHILATIDNKIDANQAINAELESMAKTIYDYWFLQFEFPNEEGKPYKSSGGKMVWCEELKREIPEGWEACKLKDEALLIKDGTHNPPKRVMTGIPLLTGTMFGNCFLEYGKATYVSETDYHSIHSQYQPAEDDIVITKIGTIGNVNMLTKRDIPITIHCNSAIIRMKDLYKKAFQVCLFKSDEFQKRLRAVKGRSIQEFISLDKISNVLFLKPNQSIVKKFNELCNIYIQEMSVLQQQNDNLIALRDFLLPMLMNGQVTFKD